jgi:hypothetical protein
MWAHESERDTTSPDEFKDSTCLLIRLILLDN